MRYQALLSPCLQATFDKQVHQLSDLIDIINGELTKNDRKKLITLCTIDVHARDVVQRLIDERVENMSCFQWQSQLRYYQNEKSKEAQVGRQLQASPFCSQHQPQSGGDVEEALQRASRASGCITAALLTAATLRQEGCAPS